MAKISLRSYQKEIESLTEGGQIEEAVAHCRYILSSYPKDVETYRLLGKAYLEIQRYGDAGDVFQRVLSTVPDDFVAHLGMSIIREDEGNLNEAIWHMERAFEVQPSNTAVQSELRRLYGRRDGLEPPRIRLTRGALARMYMKGSLYQQAIAELRAALQESPQRLDLQLLLSSAYAASGQKAEAAEIITTLLRKLPYCQEGNRIMVDILSGTEHTEESRVYRQRLQALDPYYAFLGVSVPTVDRVSDQAVTLEKLVWSPGMSGKSGQPLWASSLGIQLSEEKSGAEPIPDWLDTETDTSQPEGAFPGSETQEQHLDEATSEPEPDGAESKDWLAELGEEAAPAEEGAEIPEWMKAAGWEPATGAVDESKTLIEFPEEASATGIEGELAAAEIPDWLRDMAPEASGPEEAAEATAAGSAAVFDLPDWLKETEQPEEPVEAEASGETPTFIQIGEEAQVETTASEAEQAGEPETSVSEVAEPGSVAAEAEIPAWIGETEAEEVSEPEVVLSDQAPEYDMEGEEAEPETVAVAGEQEPAMGETLIETTPVETSFEMEGDAAFAWLESLAAKQGADEGELLLQPEERQENPPDWVTEAAKETGPAETTPESELPEWLRFLKEEEPAEETQTAPEAEAETDWLPAASDETVAEEAQPFEAETQPIPDWLSGLKDTEEEPTVAESEAEFTFLTTARQEEAEPVEESAETTAEAPFEMDELPAAEAIVPSIEEEEYDFEKDSAFAWLDSLSSRKEAGGEELAPEEQAETPSDWVLETDLEPSQPTVIQMESGDEELGAPAEAEIPDWLLELQSAGEAEDTGTAPAAEASLPSEAEGPATPDTAVESLAGEEVPDYLADTKPVRVRPAMPAYEEPAAPTILSRPAEEMAIAEAEAETLEPSPAAEMEAAPEELLVEAEGEEMEMAAETLEAAEGVEVTGPVIEAGAWEAEAIVAAPEEVSPAEPEVSLEEISEGLVEEPEPAASFEEEIPAQAASEPAFEAETEAEAIASSEDEDAAFAWLESLAAKQGAEEDELLLQPEERLEQPPEWVTEGAETGEPSFEVEAGEEEAEIEPAVSDELQAETLPVWLRDIPAQIEMEAEATAEDQVEPEPVADEAEVAEEAHTVAETVVSTEEETFAPPEEEAVEESAAGETAAEPTAIEEGTDEAGMPELPAWLAEPAEAPSDELEWTPPEVVGPVAPRTFDLNQASLAELERLPGVGFIMAQQIVTYREENGQFEAVDDLLMVPDFNPALLDEIRERLYVEPPAALTEEISPAVEQPAPPTAIPAPEIDETAPEEVRQARQAMQAGSLDDAARQYSSLVRSRQNLDLLVTDLGYATQQHPEEPGFWQALGDAYMRMDRLQEALEAYTRAEGLLQLQ